MSNQLPAATGPIVLPFVRAESRPGGVALVRQAGGDISVAIPIVGGAFVLLGGLVAFIQYAVGAGGWFIGVLFAVIGLGLLGGLGWKLFRRATLGDAELLFPRMPLRLGEPMTVRFRQQRLRGRAPVQGVSARIRCDEWVRYRQGTDTRTSSVTLWEAQLPGQPADPLGTAEVLTGTWHLRLPPELPPSFDASDNKLRWTLTVQVDIPGRPDIRNAFTLPVVPEVVRDLR